MNKIFLLDMLLILCLLLSYCNVQQVFTKSHKFNRVHIKIYKT